MQQKKQWSEDGGLTWYDVDPLETRNGRLIEEDSDDCYDESYNPKNHPYYNEYLTIEALQDGSIGVSSAYINYELEYSINGGDWKTLGTHMGVKMGDKVRLRGNNGRSGGVQNVINYIVELNFSYNIYGNINTLHFGNPSNDYDKSYSYEYDIYTPRDGECFIAENLVLPATTFDKKYAYPREVFGDKLIKAPVMYARRGTADCYRDLLKSESLRKIAMKMRQCTDGETQSSFESMYTDWLKGMGDSKCNLTVVVPSDVNEWTNSGNTDFKPSCVNVSYNDFDDDDVETFTCGNYTYKWWRGTDYIERENGGRGESEYLTMAVKENGTKLQLGNTIYDRDDVQEPIFYNTMYRKNDNGTWGAWTEFNQRETTLDRGVYQFKSSARKNTTLTYSYTVSGTDYYTNEYYETFATNKKGGFCVLGNPASMFDFSTDCNYTSLLQYIGFTEQYYWGNGYEGTRLHMSSRWYDKNTAAFDQGLDQHKFTNVFKYYIWEDYGDEYCEGNNLLVKQKLYWTPDPDTITRREVFGDDTERTIVKEYNSSECSGENKGDITKLEHYNEYLTFKALDAGTFTYNGNRTNFYMRVNGGPWKQEYTQDVMLYDIIEVKNTMTRANTVVGGSMFNCTFKYDVYGNINSMYNGDDFKTINGTYNNMFTTWFVNQTNLNDSSGLVLPYGILNPNMYSQMFQGCTYMRNCPQLLAKTLVSGCYNMMFYNCSYLSYIKCLAKEGFNSNNCLNNWVYGVSEEGDFVRLCDVEWTRGVSGEPQNWEDHCDNGGYIDSNEADSGGGSQGGDDDGDDDGDNRGEYFTIEALEGGNIRQYSNYGIQYSLNGGGWTILSTMALAVKAGDKVRMKNTKTSAYYRSGSSIFTNLPKCNIYGNINSMYAGDDFTINVVCYENMFYFWFNDMPIVDASNLVVPYTELADSCCYYMFEDCTSLETAPQLPATKLAEYCYDSMFQGCKALTTAPELPATKLVKGCYEYMFYNCSNLNYVKCLAEDIDAINGLNNWVYGVSPTGTFVRLCDVEWTRGISAIPSGWEDHCDNGGDDVDDGDYVDLGLPSGTLWQTCNVGATKPYEWGTYFRFYRPPRTVEGNDGVAPTFSQLVELKQQCTYVYTTYPGIEETVNGIMFTGPNGNKLFLPAAGYKEIESNYPYKTYYYSQNKAVAYNFYNENYVLSSIVYEEQGRNLVIEQNNSDYDSDSYVPTRFVKSN